MCSSISLLAQNSVDLKIRKKIRDRLDEIVFEYEQFSRFSTSDEITNFKQLFSPEAIVFDYLTPNYVTRNTGQEVVKNLDKFIEDVATSYPSGLLQSRITDTNLGEAIDYRSIDWSDPRLEVQLTLTTVGEYFEGGQFSNQAVLNLQISFDTLSGTAVNFKIEQVDKINSELRYLKEERTPYFEKQVVTKTFFPWNQFNVDVQDGDYFVSEIYASPVLSESYGFNLIRILSAPEPEEFGLSLGLSYTISNYQIQSDNFFYSYLTTDRENDAVYRNVTGADLVENVRSELVELPVLFRYERKFSRVLSLFINSGLSLSYHFRSYHNGSGTFSYSGYYPKYNLVVTDVEEYGFQNGQEKAGSFDIQTSRFSRDYFGLSGNLEAGINLENKKGWVLYLGGMLNRGIIANNRITDFNYITTSIDEYNGLFPVVNEINFGGYGFIFGLRKRFRSRNGLVRMIEN